MLIFAGFAVVILSVFGGFALSGGHLGPLFQPTEVLMILGGGVGAFIAANNGKALKATLKTCSTLKHTASYDRALYMDLMGLLYQLLNKIRREGMLGVEADIENPQDSSLFQEYPKLLKDPLIINFITDYLRMMVSGSMEPMELDELMLHEIEGYEHEMHVTSDALAKLGDGMPAFGIVAAVMGVVKALSAADAGPDEMGIMIAHALVGTFLGILIGYGFINPVAGRIERQVSEALKVLQCVRVVLLASLHGYAPQIAVEFGRKALYTAERPSFIELEQHVKGSKAQVAE
ncbi:flagellar motor stator protein MotA [Porticoccus sp.]